MKDFEHIIVRVSKAMEETVQQGVREVVDELGATSQDRVPYDQGDLSRSMKKTTRQRGDIHEGAVSFDQPPYDEIQHRREDFRHDNGRTHNYLGGPFEDDAERYIAHIAKRAGDAVG